jgi:hypothetical protein
MEKPDCQTSRIFKQAHPKESVNFEIIILKCEITKVQNSEGLTSRTSRLHFVHLPVTLRSIFTSPFDLPVSLTSDFVNKVSNSRQKSELKLLAPTRLVHGDLRKLWIWGFWHCNCACRIYRAFAWLQYVSRSASTVRHQAPPLLPPRRCSFQWSTKKQKPAVLKVLGILTFVIQVFWDVAVCHWLCGYRRFERPLKRR